MSDEVVKAVDEARTVVAAVYVVPTAGKVGNSVAMADATGTLLQQVLDRASAKTAAGAMGNPYPASDFPKIGNRMCTFSNPSGPAPSPPQSLYWRPPPLGPIPVVTPNF